MRMILVTIAFTRMAERMDSTTKTMATTIAMFFAESTDSADMRGTIGRRVCAVSDQPIHLTPQGPPRTVLPVEDADIRHQLQQALSAPPDDVRARVAAVVA